MNAWKLIIFENNMIINASKIKYSWIFITYNTKGKVSIQNFIYNINLTFICVFSAFDFLFVSFWLYHVACEILVPWPAIKIKPMPRALGAGLLKPWTSREEPRVSLEFTPSIHQLASSKDKHIPIQLFLTEAI